MAIRNRRLFGIFHPAEVAVAARRALLICGPSGQEGVRAHRMLRVLAQRLARAGLDVLRFDAFGTGDSAGDDTELELDGWAADIRTAGDELARRSRAPAQWWLGARLGATAACRAVSARAARLPGALILCEPVIDGARYARALAEATVGTLEASCSIKDPRWRVELAHNPQVYEREGVGFALGDKLQAQLARLKPAEMAVPVGLPTWLVGPLDAAPASGEQGAGAGTRAEATAACATALASWAVACRERGVDVQYRTLPFDFDWTAEEALNTALVPHDMVRYLAEIAESASGA